MTAVVFREHDHSYWTGSRRLAGVTEVLRPLYGDLRFVAQDLLDYKSALGKAVHRAVELHVKDDLVYDSLDPVVAQYFEQYLLFEAETGFKPLQSEVVVSSVLGYAGTLDLVGKLADSGAFCAVVDIKTTAALSPAVKLQTAAYMGAFNESSYSAGNTTSANARYALRLTPTNYRLHQYKPSEFSADLAAFLGLLKIHQWALANAIAVGEINHV